MGTFKNIRVYIFLSWLLYKEVSSADTWDPATWDWTPGPRSGAGLGPPPEEGSEEWPQLLLSLKSRSQQTRFDVLWFDPNTRNEYAITGIHDLDPLYLQHPVATGSATKTLVCIEGYTFFCKYLRAPVNVEVSTWVKLFGVVDISDIYVKNTLHLEMNPYTGNQVMYLEPFKQAMWLYYPLKNKALFIGTLNDENPVNFKVDWTNGLLFTTNTSIISTYSFERGGITFRHRTQAAATYLSNDPEGRYLYWTNDTGSVFKKHYDEKEISAVAGNVCVAFALPELSLRPLYVHNGTAVCIQNAGGSLKLLRFSDKIYAKTIQPKVPIHADSFLHYNIYTNTTLDPAQAEVVEECGRCSHFCVPINNSSKKFECGCPHGFDLLDDRNCENPAVVAAVSEFDKTSKLRGAPAWATHVLQLIDVMNSSTWTYAYASSSFNIIPSDDAHRLCLHFPSNNSLECFSPYENWKPRDKWYSSPGDVLVKVVGQFQLGTCKIFFVSRQKCVQVFQNANNITYTLYCDDRINPNNMIVDEFRWRLILGTDEGLKIVDLPILKESEISSYKSVVERDEKFDGMKQRRQIALDFDKELLYFFLNDTDDLLTKIDLNDTRLEPHIFQTEEHRFTSNAMIYRENLLYLDNNNSRSRIVIMGTDKLAGIENLHEFPKTWRNIQFTMVDYPRTNVLMDRSKPRISYVSLCPTSGTKIESSEQKCWCPTLMSINGASECRPTELLIGVKKLGSSSRIYSTQLGSSELGTVPTKFRFEEVFTHEPDPSRICVFSSQRITCTTYGSDATVQSIEDTPSVLAFAEKVKSTSKNVFWVSATGSANRLCLNMGFPKRGKRMRYSCFQEDATLQYPHFIEETHTLIWTKTAGGRCQLRSCDINVGNVTSLTEVPGNCYGAAVESESEVSQTKVFVLTSKGLYETNTLNGPATVLFQQELTQPQPFKLHNDFLFLTSKIQAHSKISVVGPLSNQEIKAQQPPTVFTSEEINEEIVDVKIKIPIVDQRNPNAESQLCASASCKFHCEVQSGQPICMCEMQEAAAPAVGTQFEQCRPEDDGDKVLAFLWWPIPVSVLILIVFGIAISLVFWRKLRKQDIMFQRAINTFIKGNESQIQYATTEAERALHLPFTAIIPSDELEISQSKLGEGNFGVVCQGTYKDKYVAVKTVKNTLDAEIIQDFLKELKIMSYVGLHENIVEFFGAEISEIQKGNVRVVLELCSQGSLELFLRKYVNVGSDGTAAPPALGVPGYIDVEAEAGAKSTQGNLYGGNSTSTKQSEVGTGTYANVFELQRTPAIPNEYQDDQPTNASSIPLLTKQAQNNPNLPNADQQPYKKLSIFCTASKTVSENQLRLWAQQIAAGMNYLEQKNVVHGDLATRNILVCDDLTVKISDFGFSKNMYQSETYRKKKTCPLPWRWASPETLSRLEFSFKADVWSYGITIWEIFTLGGVPFPDLNWDSEFLEKLKQGMKPPKPQQMSRDLYESVLCRCWRVDPGERPDFGSLKALLDQTMP